MCNPEISAANLEYIGYSTPISAAKEYMDEETVSNEISYPPEDVLARGDAFKYLDVETSQLCDALWLQVKTQGSVDSYAIVCMCALVVFAIAYLTIHNIRKKKRIANRCKRWKAQI